ncbi:hypothetical protein ACFW1A_26545 [Kitasatospora sp. NPDC058965]|uniref:hypothetical protein n=1 Tax=Kitasatospora sp. NPDC058965 TaxID=3346682 RepID=UPI0036B89B9B
MTSRRTERGGAGPGTWLVLGTLAAWFTATVSCQHPQQSFDRLRDYDRLGALLPNWRFFAPEPAQHDFHLLHRVLSAADEPSPWLQTTEVTPRAWVQAVWFPGRRREKAMFDLCVEVLTLMGRGQDVTRYPAYRLLRDRVARRVWTDHAAGAPPQGFQFLIARAAGYDQEAEPDYVFVSPFVPLEPTRADRSAHAAAVAR